MGRVKDLTEYIELKDGVDVLDFLYLNPFMLMIIAFVAQFLSDRDEKLIITSLTDDSPLRKTNTHAHGRGCDVRIWGLSRHLRKLLVWEINRRFANRYGTGPIDRAPLVAILKSDHIHMQVRRGLTWDVWPD